MAENLIEEEEIMLSDDATRVINKDLVSFVETLKDMVGQLEPQVKALTKELSPKLNAIKANLDKDETFVLAERLSGNTGTLLEMVLLLEGLDDLRRQLEPQLKALAHEFGPRINAIKTNIDRDETFLLLERVTANTGTILELIAYLEALTDLKNQLEPQLKAMMKELSPAITSIRTFIENERTIEFTKRGFNVVQGFVEDDEVLNLVDRMPNLKAPLLKLTEIASMPIVQNLVATTACALQEAGTAQIQPVTPMKMLSMLRDKDVQRATGFLFYFLKKLGQGLNVEPQRPAPPASPES